MPKQKYTRQNWIRLVEYSSAEVSDPSEGPRIDGKLIFYLVNSFGVNAVYIWQKRSQNWHYNTSGTVVHLLV